MNKTIIFAASVLLLCGCTEGPLEKNGAQTVPVNGVILDKEDVRLFLGHEITLNATVSPSDATNKALLWDSSDKSVVTVADGLVKAIGLGTAIVTVTTEDGEFNDTCTIKVTEECQTQTKGPMTLDLGKVTATTAVISGTLDVEQLSDYDMLGGGVGFIYAPVGEELDINTATKVQISNVDSENGFTRTLTGLSYDTEYHYTIFLYKNNICQYGERQTFKTDDVQVNLSVGEITQTTATFAGNVILTDKHVLEVGLLYSLSSDLKATTSGVDKVVLTDIIDADGNFTYKAENLLNESTHYYRFYIKQGSTYTYGEVSTFKTEKVPVTIEVESIDKNVVTFKGNVQFSEAGVIEIGVQYYPKSTTSQSAGIQTKAITEISESGDFSIEISGLQLGVEYSWLYYLLQNNVRVVGDLRTFQIADLYNIQSDYNMSSATDLSLSAYANCYIISNSGLYKFKTVKGNSNKSVGSVASTSILWETFGTSTVPEFLDLIDGVCYKDGYIAFKTADTFKEGNAVIAAKDAEGNILWSWHIWLTDQPQEHIYNNNAGTMMDRNLGATSATPGDVGALGLLYQWGRKDPFLGSSSISSFSSAKSTITWPSAMETSSSVGTVYYATSHPTIFVKSSSSPYDWHYSSRDNTLWTTSDKAKSIYDPCPAGWRVPDGGNSGIWSKAGFDHTTYDSTNEGMSFSISSPSTTWYPASGYRYYYGGLGHVGDYGRYWSASPDSTKAYNLGFSYGGGVYPSNYIDSGRAFGFSVRCLQESK